MVFGRKKEKVHLRESEKEKKARKKAQKANNPSNALAAEQPFEQAQAAAIGISLLKHKDQYGNEIVDPDRSNPTRHRLERPLDTIRGFERAIFREEEEKRMSRYETGTERGGNYTAASSRRQSMVRPYGDSYNSYSGRVSRNESFDNAKQYREHNQRLPYGNRGQMTNGGDQGYYNEADAQSPSVDTNSGSYASRGWNNSSNDAYSTNPSSESSSYRGRDYVEQNGSGGPPVPKKTPSPLSKSQTAYPNGNIPNGGMHIHRKPLPGSSLSRSSSNHHVPAAAASQGSQGQGYYGQGQGYYGQGQGDARQQDQGYYDYNNNNNNQRDNEYNYGNAGSQDDYYDTANAVSPIDAQQTNGYGGSQSQQRNSQYGAQQQNGGYYQQQQQQQQQQYRQQQPQYNYNPAAVQGYGNDQGQQQQMRPKTLSKQNSSASSSQKPARMSWLKRTLSKNNR